LNNELSPIASVDNAISILFAVGEKSDKSIRELSSEIGMSKSTLHRTLQTLEYRGLVKQNRETKTYSLGYSILELASFLKGHLEINHVAYPFMEKLRDDVNETIQLAVMNNDSILVVEALEGTNLMRMFSHPGETHSPTYGNFGKVFMSALSNEQVLGIIERYPLKQYGVNSITDCDEYLEKLNEVRTKGISLGIDDPIDGAFSIATPIFNRQKKVIASLALVGAKTPNNMDNLINIQGKLKKASNEISEKLNFHS